MIELIEKNIFWILMLCAVIYIGQDLFRSRKDLNKERAEKSLKNFQKAIEEANFKQWIWGFLIFLAMFLFVRGFVVVQNDAQECHIWEKQVGINLWNIEGFNQDKLGINNLPTGNIFLELPSGNIEFEQGRSYNYYVRKFNANGGRPTDINFVCNFKLDVGRFIKNVRLDYNERNRTQ